MIRTFDRRDSPLACGGARLVSAPEAGSRARARDERVAEGDDANRLGRVWLKLVSGCRRVVVVT